MHARLLTHRQTAGTHGRADGGSTPLAYVEAILERELALTLKGVELGSERDDSMRQLTDTAATIYDGRILRELIQNAYDGSGDHPTASILLRLDLSVGEFGVLDVANTGSGFGRDDVDSIVNPARSRKRPGNSIGHKGLGFRSVTLISGDPQIYSSGPAGSGTFDGFCFRFASDQDQYERLIRKTTPEMAATAAGRTHQLQLPLPIPEVPEDIARYAQEGFATLVRLPLLDQTAAANMEKEWRALSDERAPLTLFLTRLSALTLELVDRQGIRTTRELKRMPRTLRDAPRLANLDVEEVEAEGRAFLVARRAMNRERFLGAVERAIKQRHKVERWRDWAGAPTVSIAVPLGSDAPEGRYYAFLPMEEAPHFPGSIDAPFFPEPDRRRLNLANALNSELIDVAAEICVDLLLAAAEIDSSRATVIHAAVDAISWSNTARVFEALERRGLEKEKLPLPVVRQDGESRWSTLDRVFDWPDQNFQSLGAVWIARVTGERLLRRGMGVRRAEALSDLAEAAGMPLAPGSERLAGWIPELAEDLGRRRKTTAKDWEAFYADIASLTGSLPHLKGARLFRNEHGRLVQAEGGTGEDGRPTQLFINADHALTPRKRRRLDDAGVFPPRLHH